MPKVVVRLLRRLNLDKDKPVSSKSYDEPWGVSVFPTKMMEPSTSDSQDLRTGNPRTGI
jgi:hypothetical protein